MDLLDKLDLAEETQRMLRAEYPAVAALDSGAVKDLPNTGETNQQLQEQMQQRFTQIQAQIDELSEKLQESPHLALHLDVMVSETLVQQGVSEEARQGGEERSQAVLDWLEGEKRKDALIKGGGTAATAILGLLALISGPLGWSGMTAAGLGLGAGAAGTATALYEQPQLDVQDLGAQSGEVGGQQLTSMDPEEARFARILGRVNVVLGILDMGLEVGVLGRLIRQPGAMKALSRLTPEQITRLDEVVKLRQGGKTEEAKEILSQLRRELGDEVGAQVEELLQSKGRAGADLDSPPTTQEQELANSSAAEQGPGGASDSQGSGVPFQNPRPLVTQKENNWCGAACGEMAARGLGVEISQEQLVATHFFEEPLIIDGRTLTLGGFQTKELGDALQAVAPVNDRIWMGGNLNKDISRPADLQRHLGGYLGATESSLILRVYGGNHWIIVDEITSEGLIVIRDPARRMSTALTAEELADMGPTGEAVFSFPSR